MVIVKLTKKELSDAILWLRDAVDYPAPPADEAGDRLLTALKRAVLITGVELTQTEEG